MGGASMVSHPPSSSAEHGFTAERFSASDPPASTSRTGYLALEGQRLPTLLRPKAESVVPGVPISGPRPARSPVGGNVAAAARGEHGSRPPGGSL